MTDYTVRTIAEDERRRVCAVLGKALHAPPLTDDRWAQLDGSYLADRKFAAFAGTTPVGVVGSNAVRLAVPGGAHLPAAAVDSVGVRADHTRRGVLTRLIGEQFRDCVDRGDVVAVLHASEATIYGRFGYGIATRQQSVAVPRGPLRPEVPAAGQVRMLDDAEATTVVRKVYERMGLYRAGTITRPGTWWPFGHDRLVGAGGYQVVVHSDDDGNDDGFAVYRPSAQPPHSGTVLEVRDLHAAAPVALAGLWRFLLAVDLISEVRVNRPADEPVEQMLPDPRTCRVQGISDELWLRLLDVGQALNARTPGDADPVVIEVTDQHLPHNTGRYRLGPCGTERTDTAPDLAMGVDTLAMCYLGEYRPSALAGIGRVQVTDPAALSRLDTLLATTQRPWCGTSF